MYSQHTDINTRRQTGRLPQTQHTRTDIHTRLHTHGHTEMVRY